LFRLPLSTTAVASNIEIATFLISIVEITEPVYPVASNIAKYYLRVLERQASGESQPELIPNTDPGELTLEHVLPDRTDGNWPQFSEEDKRAYLNRIGNMVLLAQKMNSALRSAPFQEKKKIYAPSRLLLTARVAKFKEWTKKEIEERQRELAGLAVKAWSIKVKH